MRNLAKVLFAHFLILTIIMLIPNVSVSAQNGTSANGILTTDTLWSKAGSPYTLTGPVAVAEGITLTIEPGVTVHFNNNYLRVNGTLIAKGTNSQNIIFQNPNGVIKFNPASSIWNEQTQTGCIIENAIIGCYLDILSSPKIVNNTIQCGVYVHRGSPLINHNTFSNFYYGLNIEGNSGSVAITDNIFSDIGDVGIYIAKDNTISVTIQRNLLIGCRQGAIMVCSNATIIDNTIKDNINEGIIVKTPTATIAYNNIQNNHPNLRNQMSSNISAPNNWWGTTDSSVISQSIYDYKNDFNLGTVEFEPFLNSPNSQATPNPNSMNSPTQQPSPSLSSTLDSAPTPSVPEFPVIAVFLVFVIITFTATISLVRNRISKSL